MVRPLTGDLLEPTGIRKSGGIAHHCHFAEEQMSLNRVPLGPPPLPGSCEHVLLTLSVGSGKPSRSRA